MKTSVLNESAKRRCLGEVGGGGIPFRHPPAERICRYAEGFGSWLHEFGSTRATKREVLPETVLTRGQAWTDVVGLR